MKSTRGGGGGRRAGCHSPVVASWDKSSPRPRVSYIEIPAPRVFNSQSAPARCSSSSRLRHTAPSLLANMISPRSSFKDDIVLVDPTREVNVGLWSLFSATTVFLAARLWCKSTRRHGLWWDDHILIFSWVRYFQSLSPPLHVMLKGRTGLTFTTAGRSLQRYPHLRRVCHRICHQGRVGRPHAHTD